MSQTTSTTIQLEPVAILPCQVGDALFQLGAGLQPEKRLQLAVLVDAITMFRRCAAAQTARARRLYAEADAWFASDAADDPFTFVTICDSLGIDASYIRRGVEQWSANTPNPGAPDWSLRRTISGTRHQVVAPRVRRVA